MTKSNAQRLVNLGVMIGCSASAGICALVFDQYWVFGMMVLVGLLCANETDKLLRSM